jgi:hypothetical protein
MDTLTGIQGVGQYDAARRELEKLLEEFVEAADGPESYPSLGHQLISPLNGPWTTEVWEKFIKANSHKNGDWQEFQIFSGGESCARFFGTEDSLSSFIRMAERGMETLKKILKMMEDGKVILPDGLILRLPSCEGNEGWIHLVYDTAHCYPTPFLHADPGNWGCTGQFNWDEDGNPAHPFFEKLRSELFKSSAEALSLWLDPSQADITGDRVTDKPPVYLPPEPEQNGPIPPNEFWLWGKPYEFSPKPWLLLEFLWGQGKVKQEDAMRHIYGHADDDQRKFKSLVKSAQRQLAAKDYLAEVHTSRGYISLECFRPSFGIERLAEQGSGVEPGT